MKLTIPCSPEQIEVVADHLLEGNELGVLPDERAWMISYARKKIPNCRIVAAELNLENAEWNLTISVDTLVTHLVR